MDIRVSKSQIELEAVRYDKSTGLVPVVVQSVESGEVLMVAYANREALKRTLGTGEAWFWSRSREEYWRKGATSGNTQKVVEVRMDCDGDTILYLVKPQGPACHTGEISCFYRTVTHYDSSAKNVETMPNEPVERKERQAVESCSDSGSFDWETLTRLWDVIACRDVERPNGSYTTYLFEHGVDKIAKKVGEEATEVIIAAKNTAFALENSNVELAKESADLLYHLLALWRISKISPNEVLAILQERAK